MCVRTPNTVFDPATCSLHHHHHHHLPTALPEDDHDFHLDQEERLPALRPGPGEGYLHFIKRIATEGHTNWDAFLTVAAAQVGCSRPCTLPASCRTLLQHMAVAA